jgi:hypothetical protein
LVRGKFCFDERLPNGPANCAASALLPALQADPGPNSTTEERALPATLHEVKHDKPGDAFIDARSSFVEPARGDQPAAVRPVL